MTGLWSVDSLKRDEVGEVFRIQGADVFAGLLMPVEQRTQQPLLAGGTEMRGCDRKCRASAM